MTTESIIILIVMGACVLGIGVFLIFALIKGNLKNDLLQFMAEAEEMEDSGEDKLAYVIDKVKSKYKLGMLVNLAEKVVEILIEFSKNVNFKQ